MIKIHYNDDQDELFKALGGVMSRFIDYDARIKSACSEVISRKVLDDLRPPKGEFAQHMIIMGAGEPWSYNRNGDFFSIKVCAERFPTFMSHGAYYREHNHRSVKNSIGTIKFAAYNEKMARIELVVHGVISKAPDIYESIKRGDARANSMSARVTGDVCSICANFAKTTKEYCTHAADHMTQYLPEFRKYAFVLNPVPTFFDASDVAHPADRTAHYLEYKFADNEMRKAAAASNIVIPGADWAEYEKVCLPDGVEWSHAKQARLERLASHEQWLHQAMKEKGVDPVNGIIGDVSNNEKLAFACEAGSKMFSGELSDSDLAAFRKLRPGSFFGELAKRAAILPFRSFVAYVENKGMAQILSDPSVKKACSCILPQIFSRLLSDGAGCGNVSDSLFDGSSPGVLNADPNLNDPINKLMDDAGQKFNLHAEPMRRRIMRITIIKSASELPKARLGEMEISNDSRADFLAGIYGLYKVSALNAIDQNRHEPITEQHELAVVSHNRFCDT